MDIEGTTHQSTYKYREINNDEASELWFRAAEIHQL